MDVVLSWGLGVSNMTRWLPRSRMFIAHILPTSRQGHAEMPGWLAARRSWWMTARLTKIEKFGPNLGKLVRFGSAHHLSPQILRWLLSEVFAVAASTSPHSPAAATKHRYCNLQINACQECHRTAGPNLLRHGHQLLLPRYQWPSLRLGPRKPEPNHNRCGDKCRGIVVAACVADTRC